MVWNCSAVSSIFNPKPGGYINVRCHAARGVYDSPATNRNEEGLTSCCGHSQKFLPLTEKEIKTTSMV
jgi:hypothetical protein